MTSKNILFALVCVCFTALSCTKDPVEPGAPPSTEKYIEIKFDDNTLSIATVDSAVAVFKTPGSQNALRRTMNLSGNKLTVLAQDLSPATYEVSFEVYTKKQQPGMTYSYLYKSKQNIALPLQTSNTTTGPNGKLSDVWSPNFVFRDENKKVTLIVAERPDDPFFQIQAPNLTNYKFASLLKASYGGGNTAFFLVDNDSWLGQSNPFQNGMFSNSTAFAAYAERMKTKDWVKADFSFYLDDMTGDDVHFQLIYNKRP